MGFLWLLDVGFLRLREGWNRLGVAGFEKKKDWVLAG